MKDCRHRLGGALLSRRKTITKHHVPDDDEAPAVAEISIVRLSRLALCNWLCEIDISCSMQSVPESP
jgi:hypothetical protein